MHPRPIHKIWILYPVIIFAVLIIATPALADYLGPNRTVTATVSSCQVVLYECQYVEAKGDYREKRVEDWNCSNESKPWQAYPSSAPACNAVNVGHLHWVREETLQETIVTYPPATITGSLQNCTLQNGWCGSTSPYLSLSASEPVAGYHISLIEGTLNGAIFACPGGAASCNVPLNQGNNNFTYWALSSWGDSSVMSTSTAKVDTVSPALSLTISGASGANGWYVSSVAVTATGSDTTSGLASALLSVDGGSWQSSATLNDGIYEIAAVAKDNAGNTSTASKSISVDTTTPSVNMAVTGTPGKNGWYRSGVEVSALAADDTSGIASFEASIDGGPYQSYTNPLSFSDGEHTFQLKAIDTAGNVTETTIQNLQVDTIAPDIDLPSSWKVGETVSYTLNDTGSELATLRLVIEDQDKRYDKLVWSETVGGVSYSLNLYWDGYFKDNTMAPPGTYLVWVQASDLAGNESVRLGKVIVPEPAVIIPSPQVEQTATEVKVPTPPEVNVPILSEVEGPTPPKVAVPTPPEIQEPIPPAELSIEEDSGVVPVVQASNFGGSTTTTKKITTASLLLTTGVAGSTPVAAPDVLWGAAAAAAISAATAFALEGQRKREETAARQAVEVAQELERDEKKRISRLQEQQENWLRQQAENQPEVTSQILQPQIQEMPAWYMEQSSAQQRNYKRQQAAEEKKKKEEAEARLAAAYAAMRQIEREAPKPEPNWWEKTKAFLNKEIIQPVNTYVYKPYIKPAIESLNRAEANFNSWFDRDVRQPHIQPVLERNKAFIASERAAIEEVLHHPRVKAISTKVNETAASIVASANEKIYQPHLKPAIEKQLQNFSHNIELLKTKVYQPYIQPAVTLINEKVYQPYIQPVVDETKEFLADKFASLHENIYQPIFEPVVKDINEYIYQPLVRESKKAWDQYGEWVHGALDAAGFIPGLGEIADGINGAIYLAEGRELEATLSLLAMIPLVGDLGKAGKWTVKVGQEIVDTVVEKTVKEFAGDAIEKAAKSLVEESAQKALKESGKSLITEQSIHTALDLASLIPGAATSATAIKSLVSLAKGQVMDAAVSVASLIPLVGNVASIARNVVSNSFQRLVAKEAVEQLLEKSAKEFLETGSEAITKEIKEELVEKIAREAGEGVATKTAAETLDQSVVKTANNVKKELKEDILAEKIVEDDSNSDVTKTVEDSTVEKTLEGTPQRVDQIEFINSLRNKYGDEAFDIVQKYEDKGLLLFQQYGDDTIGFVERAEKQGIDPTEILEYPPLPNQSLEGWLLDITDSNSPVNLEKKLELQDSEVNALFEQSLHNLESDEFVLGYFDPKGENGYMEVAKQREAMHLSMSQDLYDRVGFQNGTGDFWPVNRGAIQYGIDHRKTFVLSTSLETILSNPEKFTYAEIKMILCPGNNYIHVHKDGYDMLVPTEKLVP